MTYFQGGNGINMNDPFFGENGVPNGKNRPSGGFTRSTDFVTGDPGVITRYTNESTKVTIPAEVNGSPVWAIGDKAFQDRGLEEISLPPTLRVIGQEAFADNKLKTLTIPQGVVEIGGLAFAGNPLSSVTLGDDIALDESSFATAITPAMRTRAFGGGERDVLLYENTPYAVKRYLQSRYKVPMFSPNIFYDYACNARKAGTYIFDHTQNIIQVSGFQYIVTAYGIVLIDFETTDAKLRIFNVPEKIGSTAVKAIGKGAFFAKELVGVNIPDSIVYIGDWAFQNNRIRAASLGKNTEYIGDCAFAGNRLARLVIPDNVRFIGGSGQGKGGAFSNNKMVKLALGKGVLFLGDRSFLGNVLTGILVPDNVRFIGERAFYSNGMRAVTIGAGVSRIGYRAFDRNRINNLVMGSGVASIGDWAFANNKMTSVPLGAGVRYIGYRAFDRNPVKRINIPSNVSVKTAFGMEAFPNNFYFFYTKNDKQGGLYIYSGLWWNGKWEFTTT